MNNNQDEEAKALQIYEAPSVIDIPDLVNLIADYCDDQSLSSLSRVNKDIRKMIIEESKDRYIRILEYKYMKTCLLLESLMEKLQAGQLIDLEIFKDTSSDAGVQQDQMSLYRKFLLNKYPMKTFKNFQKMNQNLENLRKKRQPQLNTSYRTPADPAGLDAYVRRYNQPQHAYSTAHDEFLRNGGLLLREKEIFNQRSAKEPPNNCLLLEDDFYDVMLKRRAEMMDQYTRELGKQQELERQQLQVLDKMFDQSSSISELVDGYFNYKVNRYKSKIEIAVKKIKGEVVCDSEIIMADLLEPQYLVNSIQDKILQSQSYLVEPFKQTYAIKEIKNIITDRIGFNDQTKFSHLPDDLIDSKSQYPRKVNFSQQPQQQQPKKADNENGFQHLNELEQELLLEHQKLQQNMNKIRGVQGDANPQTTHTVHRSQSFDDALMNDYKKEYDMPQHTQKQPPPIHQQSLWTKLLFSPFYSQMGMDPITLQMQNMIRNKRARCNANNNNRKQ